MIRDLGLDQAPVDPTTLTGDQLVKEVQRVVKALLGYGARMPKELMLYVKNLVFLDGAIARLAPDLDILAEIANISVLFAQRHGEQLGRDLGIGAGRGRPGRRQGQLRPRPERRAPDPPRAAGPPRPDPTTHARPLTPERPGPNGFHARARTAVRWYAYRALGVRAELSSQWVLCAPRLHGCAS